MRLLLLAVILMTGTITLAQGEHLDDSDVLSFFSNYTGYLSRSINQIQDDNLRSEIKKLFNEVSPILYKTISSNNTSQKRVKLKKIVKELQNIESLLNIVTKRTVEPEDNKTPVKSFRLDLTSDKYSGLSRFHHSLVGKTSRSNLSEPISEDEVVTRLQQVLGQSDGADAVNPVNILTLHKDFNTNSTKVIPPWDPRSAVGKPTTKVPYQVKLDILV